MKKWSFWGGIATACLTLWAAYVVYNKATDGFNIHQITSSISPEFFLETKCESAEIKNIFNSPIHYLGKGAQSYVFETEDGKYVVKFFKHKHLRSLHWLENFRLPSAWIKKKIEKRDIRIRRIFASSQLSYETLSKECGVVCVHLNQKPFLERHITLVNKLGLPNSIYLDEFQFVIQKKAIPLKQILIAEQDALNIRMSIDQVCQAIIERMKCGVRDADRAVINNLAYLPEENRMLLIDYGQFYLDKESSEAEIQKELVARLNTMSVWSKTHAPQITPIIQEKIQTIEQAL